MSAGGSTDTDRIGEEAGGVVPGGGACGVGTAARSSVGIRAGGVGAASGRRGRGAARDAGAGIAASGRAVAVPGRGCRRRLATWTRSGLGRRGGRSGRLRCLDAAPGSGSPWRPSRFVPLPPPGLGLGFSIGVGNSEDRSSRSSTAAPALRVPLPGCDHASVVLSPRERDRRRPRAAAASISTEAGCSRSSVESGLRSSNAVVKAGVPPASMVFARSSLVAVATVTRSS
ncbi:uncharacterized protein [Miscanthus floridulus]|uniref:uncharacterized protein n=1 Tax=Miscanthus floridulus TaxID=154761 RepID=UPI0034581303